MAYETLFITHEETFAVITLNRPPANAINPQLMTDLNDALTVVEFDDAVRAVIITGAGDRMFCAGADLGSAFAGGDLEGFIRFSNRVLRRIERFAKPVVAAMNGHALGGGCEIAMATSGSSRRTHAWGRRSRISASSPPPGGHSGCPD